MSERVVVPTEMLMAARNSGAGWGLASCEMIVEAALLWLDERLAKLTPVVESQAYKSGYLTAIEQVRRMFRAEPDVPEAVEDLLYMPPEFGLDVTSNRECLNEQILEAYRRGLRGKPVVP